MKLNKKKVFVTALAVSLIAILSMGTIAWFSGSDEVTNEFKFADSDEDGNTDFSVDVKETGDDEGDGLVFTEILPGDVLEKDPTIVNTSSSEHYSQYIRVTLTLEDPTGAWKTAFDEKRIGLDGNKSSYLALLDEMFQTVDYSNVWELAPGDEGTAYGYDKDEFFWVFYLRDILEKGEEVKLFETVTIPTGLTVEDASAMQSSFDVNVKAEAVQSEKLNMDYPSPDNAFKKVGMPAVKRY